MELVCNQVRVREESFCEVFKRITKIKRDPVHILTTRDVFQLLLERCLGFPFRDLEHAFVFIVDHQGCELGGSEGFIALKRVLINPDDLGPGVLLALGSELKVPIIHFVKKARGTAEVAPHPRKITISVASMAKRAAVAFSVAEVFSDARHGFGKGLSTGLAPQSPLLDPELDQDAVNGGILDAHLPVIVGAVARMGAFGTVLGLSWLGAHKDAHPPLGRTGDVL